jgi:starch phosphorylase
MPEALETWDVEMLARLLPRHLEIIFDINAQFLKQVTEKFGRDVDLIRRISLVDEYGQRRVRMAHLAIVASHKVNGVSKLHSQLMTQNIFSDFARMYPERFTNVTNGITPRRWLAQASPSLSSLIDERLGPRWRTDLFELGRLREWRDDPDFRKAFHEAKFANKLRLVERAKRETGSIIDPNALFDLQVKRIHEYKRQLLNILHVIVRYNRIREEPERDWTPRVVMFAGKAASAYKMAKNIIKLINDVAKKINADPLIGDRLKVGFIPNYGVSVAELIIPAADLSQQISMAGTEASGTGNMKLALNGALTIGTLDGANIEICDAVGRENMFVFGHSTDEIESLRAAGYRPRQIYESNPELKVALDQIRLGHFSPDEPHRFYDIFHTLVDWGDHYMVLADFDSFDKTQAEVDAKFLDKEAWTRSAIENVAGMGIFSSDRTIGEYAKEIWHVEPLDLG